MKFATVACLLACAAFAAAQSSGDDGERFGPALELQAWGSQLVDLARGGVEQEAVFAQELLGLS